MRVMKRQLLANRLGSVGRDANSREPVQKAAAVGYLDGASRSLAIGVASAIRRVGYSCDLALKPEKARKFFNRADKTGANRAIYIGPDECASGQFEIKPLRGGSSVKASIEDLGDLLKTE